MTVSRPSGLQAGVEIAWRGQVHVVVAVTGASVRLADAVGDVTEAPLAALVNDPTLELVADVCAPLVASDIVGTVQEKSSCQPQSPRSSAWKWIAP